MKKWPREEVELMLAEYQTVGPRGIHEKLRHRSLKAIQQKAVILGLSDIRDDSRCVEDFVGLPATTLTEQLECTRFRKWRGPVTHAPLVPSLGRAA